MLSICLAMLLPATAGATDPRPVEESLRDAINRARHAHGLAPLRMSDKLLSGSRRWARTILRTDRFGHASLDTSGFRTVGEALGYTRGGGVRRAVRMWLSSPGHRALLLNPRFRALGAAGVAGRLGSAHVTVWVARFGGG